MAKMVALVLCSVLALGASVPFLQFAMPLSDSGLAYAAKGETIDSDSYWKSTTGEADGRKDAGTWNEGLFSDYQTDKMKNTTPTGFVDIAQDILVNKAMPWLVTLLIAFMVIRMVGRAILEMVARQDRKSFVSVPFIFMTSAERKSGKVTKDEWVLPMLKENFLYAGLTLFVFTILGLLISLVIFGLGQANSMVQ